MDTPFYSNDEIVDNSEVLKKRIINILSQDSVNDINSKITFINHGIFIYSQYKERRYIINSFAEEVFWKLTSRLYVLFHDCGSSILYYFLEEVSSDGKQDMKPFLVTTGMQKDKIEQANKFLKSIEDFRHLEQHISKPDSNIDRSKEARCKNVFKKILKKDYPETTEEWDLCINWICNNCNDLNKILIERLKYVDEHTNELQRKCLLGAYYRCIQEQCGNLMGNLVTEVLRIKRKSYKKIYIHAQVEKYKEDIVNKAIELLESSVIRIDPYKAFLQAAQYYIS